MFKDKTIYKFSNFQNNKLIIIINVELINKNADTYMSVLAGKNTVTTKYYCNLLQ